MRSAPADARGGLRAVWGVISPSGLLVQHPGSADWTHSRTSLGVIVIRFPPFRGLPTVTVTPTGLAVSAIISVTADSAQVNSYVSNSAGTLQDTGFQFHIEGRAL